MMLSAIQQVELDEGTFKYVLILAKEPTTGASKLLVRGYQGCEFHADVLATAADRLRTLEQLQLDCLGGGRIAHDRATKTVRIYGYSQGFGRADHAQSYKLCSEHFGDGYDIRWSNEGY
mmetsp:Transcript_2529/g.5326  ORF Transcript_2529/g.5326 Transcript_2529/m.5326 type:complete len:119 (-) Transcript_2529:23-379(-)